MKNFIYIPYIQGNPVNSMAGIHRDLVCKLLIEIENE